MKIGFRTIGIFPFNPLILPEEAFAPSTLTELPPPETNAMQNVTPFNSQQIEIDPTPETRLFSLSDEYLTTAASHTNEFVI